MAEARGRSPAREGRRRRRVPDLARGARPEDDDAFWRAFASPWRGQVAYASPEESGYAYGAAVDGPAIVGALAAPLGPGREGRFDHGGTITVSACGVNCERARSRLRADSA